LEKNKGRGNMQTTTSTEMQLDEFAVKFEKDFSLVSFLSTNTTTKNAWYLDTGAYRHMKKSWEIFSSLMERDLGIHVELGDDAKYAMKGEGIVLFQLDSRGSFDAHDVIYVTRINNNFLSVSNMEDRSFVITF
jgi:hypothetical protein